MDCIQEDKIKLVLTKSGASGVFLFKKKKASFTSLIRSNVVLTVEHACEDFS